MCRDSSYLQKESISTCTTEMRNEHGAGATAYTKCRPESPQITKSLLAEMVRRQPRRAALEGTR